MDESTNTTIMIVITKIETLEVDNDWYNFVKIPEMVVPVMCSEVGPCYEDVELISSLIKGVRFRHPSKHDEIVIGFSESASEILGLSYDAYNNQRETIENQQKTIIELESKIKTTNKLIKEVDYQYYLRHNSFQFNK